MPVMSQDTTTAKEIVQKLKNFSHCSFNQPTKIIVFTDVGRDIDDAVLLVILAWLHKIGVVEILLVVTNVKPSKDRASEAKFIFTTMGVSNIQVAYGTDGTDGEVKLHNHELKRTFKQNDEIQQGKEALVNTLRALHCDKKKCSIIVISSLRDLSELIEYDEFLVESTVSSVFLQGAWKEDEETQTVKTLIPDLEAMNNSYDPAAATHVHDWLLNGTIPTYTSTKYAALRAPIDSEVFHKAAKAGHQVARYIYNAFKKQERTYFDDAAQEDPPKRFKPHLDKKWFVARTSWSHDFLPEKFKDILPFIRMTLYDVVAGLVCPFLNPDIIVQIYQPHKRFITVGDKRIEHWIIGRSTELPDINPELLSNLITELLQEALADKHPFEGSRRHRRRREGITLESSST